jgi:hypothetical protein
MNKKIEGLSFDAAFGEGGFVRLNNSGSGWSQVVSIMVLADGSFVAVSETNPIGKEGRPLLVKFSSTGELVADFGEAGYSDIDFRSPSTPWALVSVSKSLDEKCFFVLAVGKFGFEFRLVCLNENGRQVMDFGDDGVVVMRADAAMNLNARDSAGRRSFGHVRMSDLSGLDKNVRGDSSACLTAGIVVDENGVVVHMTPAYGEARVYSLIRRYTYQGMIDTTFGDNNSGQVAVKGFADAPAGFESLVVTRGVVVLNDSYLVYGNITTPEFQIGVSRGFVKKLDLTGRAVEGFGKEGYVLLPNTYDDRHIPYVGGVMIDSEDRIVGYTGVAGIDYGAGLFRLSKDGVFDATFHGDTDFRPEGTAMIVGIFEDEKKRLVTCGNALAETISPRPFVARWTPNGDVDSSFGERGWLLFPSIESTELYSLALQNGQALIGGKYASGERNGFVARMLPFDGVGQDVG